MKGEWRSAACWRYQINAKKCRNFTRVQSQFLLGPEILVKHHSIYNKTMQQFFTSVKSSSRSIFSIHLFYTRVASWTFRWCNKTSNVIGLIFDHWNVQYESATALGELGKVDPSGNFIIFHWRRIVIRPAWKNGITFMSTDAFVRHSCSCYSNETMPSPGSTVTWHFIEDCDVSAPSIGITHGFVINTWVDYKIEW